MIKISQEEENKLGNANDFSVIQNERTKETFLLFGPIRVVNHHCTDHNTTVSHIL
jgi:hypothetical protein